MSVYDLKMGECGKITKINLGGGARARLTALGIKVGKTLEVLKAGNFASDVLAEKVAEGTPSGFTRDQNVNGEKITLTLIKK